MGLVNSGIAVMSLLLVAFIFSFSERQVQSGVPIEVKFPSMPDTPKLATEIYESNPLFAYGLIPLIGEDKLRLVDNLILSLII